MGYKHDINDVIREGSALIQRRGYHAVGVNDVLRVTGIPKGSFYNFFKSKEEFAEAILDAYGADYAKWVRELVAGDGSGPNGSSRRRAIDRIDDFYRALTDANEADDFNRGCLIAKLSNELARESDRLAEVCERNFQLLIGGLTEVLAQAQEEGDVRDDYTAAQLAEYCHAGFYGQFPRANATRTRLGMDAWRAMTMQFLRGR